MLSQSQPISNEIRLLISSTYKKCLDTKKDSLEAAQYYKLGNFDSVIYICGELILAFEECTQELTEQVIQDDVGNFVTQDYASKVSEMANIVRKLQDEKTSKFKIPGLVGDLKSAFNSFSAIQGFRSCPEILNNSSADIRFAIIYLIVFNTMHELYSNIQHIRAWSPQSIAIKTFLESVPLRISKVQEYVKLSVPGFDLNGILQELRAGKARSAQEERKRAGEVSIVVDVVHSHKNRS